MKKNIDKKDKKRLTKREKNPDAPLSTKERVALAKKDPSFVRRAVDAAKDRSDRKHMEQTASKRAMHKERWDDICGGEYTLDHPVVSLEWKMCDYDFLKLFMSGRREEAFKQMTPEEIDVYLNGYPELGIGPYGSVEDASLVGAAWKTVAHRREVKVELCEAHQKTE